MSGSQQTRLASLHDVELATLSATGNPTVQAGFGPLVEGFVRVPLNDIAALQEVASRRKNVVAVPLTAESPTVPVGFAPVGITGGAVQTGTVPFDVKM